MKKFVGMASVLLITAALAGCQSHTKTEKSDSSTKVTQQSKKDTKKQKAKKEKERWEKKVAAREAKAASESRARAESESRAASAKAASESSAAAASSAARAASESKAAAAQDNLGSTLTNNEWFYLAYYSGSTGGAALLSDVRPNVSHSMFEYDDGRMAISFGSASTLGILKSVDATNVVFTWVPKADLDGNVAYKDHVENKQNLANRYLHSQEDVDHVKALTDAVINWEEDGSLE